MRLATLIPAIPAALVASLQKCDIRTDTDLLFSCTALDILRRLPPGTATLHELTKYIGLVAELTSAQGISGVELISQELDQRKDDLDFSSGIHDLNVLLGSFGGRRVLEIAGDTKSGKTVGSYIWEP